MKPETETVVNMIASLIQDIPAADVKDARILLRRAVFDRPKDMALCGFRYTRKTRVSSDDVGRWPTPAELAEADRRLLTETAHEIEQDFRSRNVNINRHMLSMMRGARP
jgi:hypothetical protein